MPSVKGAVMPQAWLSEIFIISFYLPLLADGERGMKWGMISVSSVVFTMVVTNLLTLFLFGSNVTNYLYPVMAAARYISIADFLENLEAAVIAIWVFGAFIKISVFYYATVLGTAQWMNLSDYRPIVLPLGLLMVMFSFWDIPNLTEFSKYDVRTWPFYGFSFQTMIPLLLLVIAVIRKRRRKGSFCESPE